MKKILLISLLLQLTYVGHTQTTLNDMYVGFFAQDKDSFASQDRWNFDVSYEHWLESPKGTAQKPFSFGLGLNRMFDFSLSRNHSFAFGLGMHWLNHYSNADFYRVTNAENTTYDTVAVIPAAVKYKTNKYVLHFIDFNAEIRLRFGHERNVKVYLGFRGSYLLGSHTKYRDSNGKFKRHDINGFSELNYGPTLRLGIGRMSLYGCYYLQPVYSNGFKQDISSVSLGMSFFYL